jgi:transcriptional regulator with XRE-family HTH domain
MVEQSIDLIQFSNRLRSARSLVNMNRKEFCEKHDFNLHTVQSWESGRYWVRAKSLERFCDALAKEGVFCSPDWIVEGKGDGPKLVSTGKDLTSTNTDGDDSKRLNLNNSQEERLVQAEVDAFMSAHKNEGIEVVATRATDNAMLPQFRSGDFVGGRILVGEHIKSLFGKDCIVEIGPENFLVRRLCSDGQRIVLVPTVLGESVLSFERVVSAAEIIWHRRMQKHTN